jgi:hypothetical protein
MIINVQGSIPPNASQFSINLACGPGDVGSADIAVHINPRFNENQVVRNSFQNGNWGSPEERSGPGFPLQKGSPFECIMLVQNDKFMISFNGQHFCEFKHRIPKERVNHVVVKGDLQVNNVFFSGPGSSGGGFAQPSTQAGGYGQPAGDGQPAGYGQPGGYGQPAAGGYGQPQGGYGQPQGGFGGPGAPNRKMIPGGMTPGKIIYINATPTPNASKFSVNLKYQEQGGDLAFHFNPRFPDRVVMKNSLQNGSWGQEERAVVPFPFVAGTPFAMMVLSDPQEFKVAVNQAHFTEFRLRNPNLQAVQWVEVDGDLTGVTINIP